MTRMSRTRVNVAFAVALVAVTVLPWLTMRFSGVMTERT